MYLHKHANELKSLRRGSISIVINATTRLLNLEIVPSQTLAYALEDITGKPCEHTLQESILDPAATHSIRYGFWLRDKSTGNTDLAELGRVAGHKGGKSQRAGASDS